MYKDIYARGHVHETARVAEVRKRLIHPILAMTECGGLLRQKNWALRYHT